MQLAIQTNIANNFFSIYDPTEVDGTFQIDANLAYPGAVMVGPLLTLFSTLSLY
jgi:hypothetical protein